MKRIIDSTLREGEQAPGVCFGLAERCSLVELLSAAGVDELELGHGVGDPDLPALVAHARTVAPGRPLAVWCRALPDDIAIAGALGVDRLAMSLPVSDEHLTHRLRRDRGWLLTQVAAAADWSRAAGFDRPALGLEDATRADRGFLAEVLRACADAGIQRVRLADTLGLASPATMAALVAAAREQFDGELAVHCHNDFGMGTANAVAALEAGADLADGSVLGLGERSGLAATEQLLAWLALSAGQSGYRTELLPALCQRVSECAGRPLAGHQPVVGGAIFTCESGLHVDGLLKHAPCYEPFEPSCVGGERRLLLGKQSGRRAVAHRLRTLGLTDELAAALAPVVRRTARALGRPLTDPELRALHGEHALTPGSRS